MADVEPGRKLLSIFMTGRDDDYMLDFRYRLTTTLNYLARNITRLGQTEEVEVLITDWGSPTPLSKILQLSPEAQQICRFIYVPPATVRAVQGGKEAFHVGMAMNTAMRRAQGEFLMVSPADTLIPEHSLNAILKILKRETPLPVDVNRTFFSCRRYQVPWKFVDTQPSLDQWDQYLLLNPSALECKEWWVIPMGAGAGGYILHRKWWLMCRGVDEALEGWGSHDTDLMIRLGRHCPWVDPANFGVVLFHMDHSPYGRRGRLENVIVAKKIPHPVPMSLQLNTENWGLGQYELEIQKAEMPTTHLSPQNGAGSQGNNDRLEQDFSELVHTLTGQKTFTHVRKILEVFIQENPGIPTLEIEALFLVTWYTLHHNPSRYLELGVRHGCTAMAVGAARSDVEIYDIDDWTNTLTDDRGFYHVMTMLYNPVFDYRGYSRLITGEATESIRQLSDSFIGKFSMDLMLIRGDLLKSDAVGQVGILLQALSEKGALILSCKSPGDFEGTWSHLQKQFPALVYLRCRSGKTGLVLTQRWKHLGSRNLPQMPKRILGWMVFFFLRKKTRRVFRFFKNPAAVISRWVKGVGASP